MATRLTVVHVAGAPGKPAKAAVVRALAARAVTALGDSAPRRDADDWIASVREAHAARIGRLLAREQAIAGRADTARETQPGLFDSRALERAKEVSAVQDALDAEHRRRSDALSRAATLRLTSIPVAVLISWR